MTCAAILPALLVGSGLKQGTFKQNAGAISILPALLVGSGLKQRLLVALLPCVSILPALLVGSGLKPAGVLESSVLAHSPGFIGREWIETGGCGWGGWCA